MYTPNNTSSLSATSNNVPSLSLASNFAPTNSLSSTAVVATSSISPEKIENTYIKEPIDFTIPIESTITNIPATFIIK